MELLLAGRLPVIALAFVAGGCVPPDVPQGEDSPFHDEPAVLAGLWWECDPDQARWSLVVETTGWTGGGRMWLADDASTFERHTVSSEVAASDGSWDCLSLDLDVVADWRDAESGSSTAWGCGDEEDLTFLLVVWTPDGEERADCRAWGADPDLWGEVDGAETCDAIRSEEDAGDDACPETDG